MVMRQSAWLTFRVLGNSGCMRMSDGHCAVLDIRRTGVCAVLGVGLVRNVTGRRVPVLVRPNPKTPANITRRFVGSG